MIATTNIRAVTADLEDAKRLRAMFLEIAQELPAHADFARVHADTLDMQIKRREDALCGRGWMNVDTRCQLLVGEVLWTEMEVRIINAGQVERLAIRPTKSDT